MTSIDKLARRDCRNFCEILLRNFSELPDSPALKFRTAGSYQSVSYKALGEISMSIAANLLRLGLQPGERTAILSDNRPEWAYADLGVLLAGGISSAIYSSSLADEINFIINDLEAKFLFVENRAQLEKVTSIRASVPSVRRVFVFDEEALSPGPTSGSDWTAPLSALIREGPSPEEQAKIASVAEGIAGEDPMCIIYTSGTTGAPKGAVLTHNNYLKTAEIILEAIGETSGLKVNLSFLPLAHAFERFAGYYLVLYLGRTIAYAESIEKVAENFREVRPNFAVCVPRVFEKIRAKITAGVQSAPAWKRRLFNWAIASGMRHAARADAGSPIPALMKAGHWAADRLVLQKIRQAFGGQIEFFVSGGAPLGRELAEFFHAAGILIIEGWGATEGTTPYTINTPQRFKFGSVGKPLPRVSVRAAGDGELEVSGPNIFKGYWKNPAETAEAFTADGYFRTGDIGVIDAEGWVYITDRKKRLIITSAGKNIAPAAVERELALCPHIDMTYIHGDRRNYLTALIVLNEAQAAQTARAFGLEDMPWQDLMRDPLILAQVSREVEEANEKLPRFMQVKYFRIVPPFSVETGEMTPTMKLKNRVIEEKYKELLDSMY